MKDKMSMMDDEHEMDDSEDMFKRCSCGCPIEEPGAKQCHDCASEKSMKNSKGKKGKKKGGK